MNALSAPTMARSALGALTLLGEGGEGSVFETSHHADLVYKEFHARLAHELQPSALETTMSIVDRMAPAHREFVLRRTAWPQTLVTHNGVISGFLMPRVPERLMCKYGLASAPRKRTCSWDLLAYRNRTKASAVLVSDTAHVDDDRLHSVMVDLARLIDTFHTYDVIVGDISGGNILWPVKGDETVMLIDCDGIRAAGQRAVTQSKQSPDWIDPTNAGATNLQSDRYKLALAMFRARFAAEIQVPRRSMLARSASDLDRQILSMACDAQEGRAPSAADWVVCLGGGRADESSAGTRPVIALGPAAASKPISPSPAPAQPVRQLRPQLPLN